MRVRFLRPASAALLFLRGRVRADGAPRVEPAQPRARAASLGRPAGRAAGAGDRSPRSMPPSRPRSPRSRANVWIYAKNLDTGATYDLRGDERVRTASTIKLPILVAVYAEVAEGRARWDQELVLTKEKKVSGSGVLTEFADGTKLTLRDATNLMIVVSDNSATNLVLDVVSSDTVNARMDALGLTKTRSVRKIGGGNPGKVNDDPVWRLYGLGISTPHEMVTLLERLERGRS